MHRRGFSLASLLLLTAVVAIFLAAICTVWLPPDRKQVNPYLFESRLPMKRSPRCVCWADWRSDRLWAW